MKLKYLGTAAAEGLPALFCTCDTCRRARTLGGENLRTRSQTLVNDDLMIDFPADTYLHAIENNIDLTHIHHYLITHVHQDHFYPADLNMFGKGFSHVPDDFRYTFYGGEDLEKAMAPYVERLNGRPECVKLEHFTSYIVNGYTVTPLKAAHGTLDPLIYIIERDGKCLFYMHDTAELGEESKAYLRSCGKQFDLVSFDCTCGNDDRIHTGHMNLSAIHRTMELLAECHLTDGQTKMVVNHFSHNYPAVLYADRDLYENEGIIMAYDGMEIEF